MSESIKPGTRVRVTFEAILEGETLDWWELRQGDEGPLYASINRRMASLEVLPPEEPEVVQRARDLIERAVFRNDMLTAAVMARLADAYMALLAEQEEK